MEVTTIEAGQLWEVTYVGCEPPLLSPLLFLIDEPIDEETASGWFYAHEGHANRHDMWWYHGRYRLIRNRTSSSCKLLLGPDQ